MYIIFILTICSTFSSLFFAIEKKKRQERLVVSHQIDFMIH